MAVPFRLTPLGFADLPGFLDDSLDEALAAFTRVARAFAAGARPLRRAAPPSPTLAAAFDAAVSGRAGAGADFFRRRFRPFSVEGGFFTGYYEPLVEASLEPAPDFSAPLLGPPSRDGAPWRGALPDRAAIFGGALDRLARPALWLRDEVEAFMVQVQGSALARLPDGSLRRLVYAGRNGWPYRSIGALLIERGEIAQAEMSLDALKSWIRAHGQAPGDPGGALMRENPSYVFFRAEPCDDAARGPHGGAGVPLTPLRSLAVDRALHAYGTPAWIDVDLPAAAGGPLRRLMIAQDVGSAIVGPGRGDIFFGTGEAAGARAGLVRHAGAFVALRPTDERADAVK